MVINKNKTKFFLSDRGFTPLDKKYLTGFTLIELLIVIAVIAILAGVVFVALDPLARFQDARNAKRWAAVNAISDAIKLYQIDHGGAHGTEVEELTTGLAYQIGADDSGACSDTCSNPTVVLQADCVDLDGYISGEYLQEIPIDPNASGASDDETRYYLIKNDNGSVTVGLLLLQSKAE